MYDCIDNIKSKLVSAIDLEQKKILKIKDVYDALKTLEVFPMTLDILNSSRIGKIVNDIRHFNETTSDIKIRLKDLIKGWNDKLLPQKNKKADKPIKSTTNGCHKSMKVSESANNISVDNRIVYGELSKSFHSSNNIELMNEHKNKYISDCDQSFETLPKRGKYDNDIPRTKTMISESSKSQQKENHFDNKTLHNSIAQTNSLSSVDKFRKRKHESVSNGVVITPIQKVKSTMELLADMGDLVGNDTKKKILCNEIILEEDIPRSCIPESVRPRMKPIKSLKSAQSIKVSNKSMKISPKVPSEKCFDYNSPKTEVTEVKVESYNSQKCCKSSPYINDKISSPSNNDRKSHKSTPVVGVEDNEKLSLKLKIAVKHKKSKHFEPPITNRMDEIPNLVPLDDNITFTFDDYMAKLDRGTTELTEVVVDRLAHQQWDGHNITRHPLNGQLVPLVDMYIVNGLYILPWTDTVYNSRSFFPDDTADELTRISDSLIDNCS